MFLTTPDISHWVRLLGGVVAVGIVGRWVWRRAERRRQRAETARLQAERAAGHHLCFSTVEALAYAIEAADPYNIGHLDCVQRGVTAIARALELPAEETAPLRVAALLHNIGRLGVPEHILHKTDSLTPEEQEKLRAHPVLGARILASIPFPWPAIPLVRHHAEHWDGNGYPDGLKGSAIPLGARILAVANAYSALLRARPYRPAFSPIEALAEIESRSGKQFDPAVVAAFRVVAAQLREEDETGQGAETGNRKDAKDAKDTQREEPGVREGSVTLSPSAGDKPPPYVTPSRSEAKAALEDIAAAQRETLGLLTLAQTVGETLHLEAIAETALACIRDITRCVACVLFLPEDEGEFLYAQDALGVNERRLQGSLARLGTYLTGRAFTRGEMIRASFLAEDLILRDVSDPWTPFRSTLIVPLSNGRESIGTLNLYAEEPDAFGQDVERVMRLIATQVSRAINNARTFAAAQETAYTDALTGLRNARYLREHLEREINRASRDGTPVAVLNIDLDNFKPINDRYGHARGDQTLREVADILNHHIRNYDLAARYAGDEFVVTLSRAGRLPAEIVAGKLRQAVERHSQKILAKDPDFPQLGISIGIALYPDDGQDLQALLCRSDAAMYTDKQSRRAERAAA